MTTSKQALKVIRKCIKKQGNPQGEPPTTLGWGDKYDGTAVLSPSQWEAKGNPIHEEVVAIVIHEGPGPLSKFFSLDACYLYGAASEYDTFEAMRTALQDAGLWAECQNGWTTFIREL